ncbi:MAG: YihY/virulence factor BrkB family protein [Actinomycetota bacterium]|nr:YihY/virulence factor BrkB family protein [Actinomycetota bacterium]
MTRGEGSGHGVKARLEAAGERFPPFGLALAVQRRFSELRGSHIAAAIAFQAFVSLLPLVVVAVAVVGIISAESSVDVAARIVGELGLTGDAARAVGDAVATAERSRRVASLVGLAAVVWAGLRLVNALQFAYNQVWQVEERGLKDKVAGLVWLVGAALGLVATSALTTLLRWLPGALAPLGVAVTLALNFVLWLWTAKVLPNRDVGWRALVPGAVLGALGLEVLKVVGGFVVAMVASSSSQLYGSLGVVFAVLTWLWIFGRLVVYSAVLNVVLYEGGRGTRRTTIEIPAAPGVRPRETTRMGRVEKEDIPS